MPSLVLLRGAELYTPDARGRADVLVGGGTILAVAPRLDPRGLDVEVVDAANARLIPGLVDAHTHLSGGGGEGGAHTKVPAVPFERLASAGVTTAVGLLGTDCRTRGLPELLAASRALDTLGLTTFCYTGGYEVPPVTLTGSARGDLVHVDRIVAIGETAISDHRSSQPTLDELFRLASDAHVSGMLTGKAGLLHLHLGDGPRGLEPVRRGLTDTELPPRTWHPTHTNRNRRLWEEAKALSPAGLTIDISAFDPDGDAPSGGQALAEWLREGLDPARVTLSSDAGGCLPTFDADGVLVAMGVGSAHTLLASVLDAERLGAPFARALAAVTRNVARLFRFHHKGEISPGHDADLVLVRDGVATDVMARGAWVWRDGGAVPDARRAVVPRH